MAIPTAAAATTPQVRFVFVAMSGIVEPEIPAHNWGRLAL
jgi:hypothetical protein